MNLASRLLLEAKKSAQTVAHHLGYELYRRNSRLHPSDMAFLLASLKARGLKPSCVLDVGANKGEWSQMAKTVFPAANYLLIEPQSEMQPILDQFCQQHSDSQWILAGAGATSGN